MSNDTIRRNMPVFPMRVVSQLTELTPRQIRYYETHELIHPFRTDGSKRLFSLNDVEILLSIKHLLEKGFNMKGIKQIMLAEDGSTLNDEEERLRKQMIVDTTQKPQHESIPLNRGDLSRFFK
ncbi:MULTISPECIES: MerR family transcriptional regulator [unclassified Staphylococcus]|uniref:MerR family transcriptional regulator n=1 Tax=unclassified Staphylococcus TaxID=91994 RepID=UPI0021D1C331|nr:MULTISPECIES: MerR family transcriptional regulator [unclassified Staphylococcus]UXR70448.1 MerR family transcriptional regulator [Staphylococcus sp. IVB6246]UXR72515.1 MerR family transcriptional regulator [Staphylococcus sp. IVB6240]UXR74818.1 MerR family transcriptional regulator [Staphylococcus sp. IVB6238]UXR77151.1 MerR family transcriptional regulator [Staphylococcus sp. IVB6233]UXR81276.1 MerR family transcriptional regulator [Staphylococcus sp. IVB6218]